MSFYTAYVPRQLRVGPLVLDILHRDARHRDRWLSLHPREFELLWRLGEAAGRVVDRRTLLRDVWRVTHEPETNSVEVHVYRLRAKLAGHGVDGLVRTHETGGYRIDAPCGEFGPLACHPPAAEAGSAANGPKAGLDSRAMLRETASIEKEDHYDLPHERACFD